MPTVTVTDVVVRSRRVRLAMTCPNCSGNLGLEGALHVRGFVGEVKIGRLARTKDDRLEAIAGIVLGDSTAESGQTFINHLHISCAHCNHPLAQGGLTIRPTA